MSGKILLASFALLILWSCNQEKSEEVEKPNFVLILADDLGWSDVGCYGGEINTPNIDQLAANGVRYTQFYNTAKCFPSRAALLTGQYAQYVGAHKTWRKPWRYETTIGKALQAQGYTTMWSGKHHGVDIPDSLGYDKYYGLFSGASNHFNPGNRRTGEPEPAQKRVRKWIIDGEIHEPYTPENPSFYTTDAFTNKALGWLEDLEKETPFFLYMSYTAPHDPLMAWPEDIKKYQDTYKPGYEAIRKARFEKQKALNLIPKNIELSEPSHEPWDNLSDSLKQVEALKMAVYAAMVDRLDQNIGRMVSKLEETGKLENTMILFMSDNGSSAEVVDIPGDGKIGTMGQWTSLGKNWANVSNTPFRYYKNYSYEGGINTPLIITGPGLSNKGSIEKEQYGHIIDILPTVIRMASEKSIVPVNNSKQDGIALSFNDEQTKKGKRELFWEWQAGKAMRSGPWKIVSKESDQWELYNLQNDPFETKDLSDQQPERKINMITTFKEWQNKYATENP